MNQAEFTGGVRRVVIGEVSQRDHVAIATTVWRWVGAGSPKQFLRLFVEKDAVRIELDSMV